MPVSIRATCIIVWTFAIALAADAVGADQLLDKLHARVANATVRVRVAEGNTADSASGTIIDRVGSKGVIATCAHVFSDMTGNLKVRVFHDGHEQDLKGTLLGLNHKFDVALVAVDGLSPIVPIPLAESEEDIPVGRKVVVAGCDNGGSPKCVNTRVTAVNRFFGRPNLEVDAIPPHGRSGGGMITTDLHLIGVCNGINTLDNDGLYSGVSAIHRLMSQADNWLNITSSISPSNRTDVTYTRSVLESSSIPAATGSRSDELEVICIIRSKADPNQPSQIKLLSSPSAAFLQALSKESDLDTGKVPRDYLVPPKNTGL